MQRSGLIIEVAEANAVVDEWRRELDPLASLGVPPHITVLFPFVRAAEVGRETIDKLHRLAASVPSFQFQLTRTGWFEQRVLWLGPEPVTAFVELTTLAVNAFPEYPPYGGQFSEVVPHLTIGDSAPSEQMAVAAQALEAALPISATARAITLLAERPDRSWQVHSRFPLAEVNPGRNATRSDQHESGSPADRS